MADAAKALVPFLQRADEMQKHDLRVAYYCASLLRTLACSRGGVVAHAPRAGRLYALEQGLSLPERSADTNALLGALMQQLEARLAARRA